MNKENIDKDKWYNGHIVKFFSVVIAIFMWFYVFNSRPFEIEQSFKIGIIFPNSLAVYKITSTTVKVTLKGARAFIENYKEKISNIKIDLSKIKIEKGKKVVYEFKKSDFFVPFGVKITSISPKKIELYFDKYIRKKVPIKVVFLKNLSKDLKLVSYSITPHEMMIKGPRNLMKNISWVKSKEVDLSKLAGKGDISLDIRDGSNHISFDSKKEILLKYDIRPKKANITLKKVPVLFISNTNRFKARSKYVNIDVLASEDRKIEKSEVRVYVRVPKEKGIFNISPEVELPVNVHFLKIIPPIVRVRKY